MYCLSSSLMVLHNPSATRGRRPGSSRSDSAGPRRTQSAWCRRGCWRAMPASPASPSRNSGSAPDGSRSPDRFWRLPPRGLAPSAACDRRCGARLDRRLHTQFFSPPLKSHDAGLGIAEHPTNCRARTKCGEAVHIHQPPLSSHPQFMPSFYAPENSAKPCGKRPSAIKSWKFIHTICRRPKKQCPVARQTNIEELS